MSHPHYHHHPQKEQQEDDPPNPTTPLLASKTSPKTVILFFSSLLVATSMAIAALFFFAFLFFSSTAHRPLAKKLPHPVVIIVSSDGFRFGYQFKTAAPNIRRLIANGTEAETGLIPVFPSLTFPNHYSIVTGLYPAFHGIVDNWFVDPVTGDTFTTRSHNPKFWLGEPLWVTAVRNGLNAATFFWPGAEVVKAPWTCPPKFCQRYNSSVPFETRVDTILGYFDLPSDEIPSFMTLYFEDPDSQGHNVGPDDPLITEAVDRIDRMVGRLISGLEQRGVFEDVTIIFLGDHGMVGTCDKKAINLDDLSPWVTIPSSWVQTYYPKLGIRPPAGVSASDVVVKMKEGLRSGNVTNGKYLQVFLKEDLPHRFHYSASERIPPIIGLAAEAYTVKQNSSTKQECGGAHGYDPAYFSMRTIFIGHGPQFARGHKVPSFQNIEIYNVVTSILKINGAPNNGSTSFPSSILLPRV